MTLRVVKIGTSLLRGTKERQTSEIIENFCECIAFSKNRGDKVVLVSSGAVGLGCNCLGMKERPLDLVSLQAAAAIGQGNLMALYKSAMEKYGYKVAQILLTRSDLGSRQSYKNASKTLSQLLEWNILPIVNENDTLSAEELRYGDNDTLSALVATAIGADQLILLTDVDRLYSSDPRTDQSAEPITDVHDLKQITSLEAESKTKEGSWGTGGIKTKLAAARIATASGITVHLSDGRSPQVLKELLKGSRGGTVFHPQPNPIGDRESWFAHAIEPLGSLQIDDGACDAITSQGGSLLLVGIEKIEGTFMSNQPVRILNRFGKELGRGLSSLSSNELSNALNIPVNCKHSSVVIHKDVLVLTGELTGN